MAVVVERGEASHRPPRGLPRDDPRAELHEVWRGASRAAPGRRVVGLHQVDGMPHEPRRGRDTDPLLVAHVVPRQ